MGALSLVKMGQLRLLARLVVIVILGSVLQQQLVAADKGVGRNLKYFKSMSFPNQVHGLVGTTNVGNPLDKVCDQSRLTGLSSCPLVDVRAACGV